MICAACQSSDAVLVVTLELVNLILSGELPREAFLLHELLIGLEKPGGGVRPIAISETWYRFAGVCALRTYGRGIGARLAPLQVGVGTPGGTEIVVFQRRGDIVAVLPRLKIAAVDVVVAHASAKSYAAEAAKTSGWTAARAERTKRTRFRKDAPDHAAFRFLPFAVETCGYMGKEAVKFVNRLGDIAAESGRISKDAFVRWAMQLLSVTVQRGNAEFYPPEWAGHLAGARFALRCWLCIASADVVMRRVYGALLVAMLVVCCVCAESGRV